MREHGTKNTPIFLPADGEACWSLLPSSVSLLPCSTVQPENTYSCIVKVTGQVWESQKRIRINTNHSYHQRSSPWAGLNWSNNKARCSFNQSNRKRWGAKLVNENIYPIRDFYRNTITRRVVNQGERGTFFPWGKTGPAGHQPSISKFQL